MCSHPEDRSGISHVLSSSPPPTCLSIPLPDDGWQRPLSLPRTALKATVRVLAGGSEVLGSSFITSSSLPPALSTAGSESAPGQRKKPEGQGAVRECSKVAVWQTGFPLRAKGPICTGHLSLLAPKNWWNFPPPPPPQYSGLSLEGQSAAMLTIHVVCLGLGVKHGHSAQCPPAQGQGREYWLPYIPPICGGGQVMLLPPSLQGCPALTTDNHGHNSYSRTASQDLPLCPTGSCF